MANFASPIETCEHDNDVLRIPNVISILQMYKVYRNCLKVIFLNSYDHDFDGNLKNQNATPN